MFRFINLLVICLSLLFIDKVCHAGYTIGSISQAQDGRSFTAQLQLNSSDNSNFGPDIQQLNLTVSFESSDTLRVYITDAKNPRWEVPTSAVGRFANVSVAKTNTQRPALQFSYTQSPFGFAVTRNSTGEVLFNSSSSGLFSNIVFKNQYLEISTALPDNASLYGIGESSRPTFKWNNNSNNRSLWNADVPSASTYTALYGSHPFYMDVRTGGTAHGVVLLNSNGMDVEYAGSYLTYKVIGGVMDFYFFAGPSPISVVQQYTALIGRPAPMPYWAFGFHQCRYGYQNLSDIQSVVARYAEANLPLESIWTDIDHMDAYKDFTLDPVNFPPTEMKAFIDEIHTKGQKYVLIVDPGIALNQSYKTFQRGQELDIFVKKGDSPYLSQVWPGPVYFPDFLNPKTQSFWTTEISDFHNTVPFDGLWIDMNEAASFCTGITCSLPTDGSSCPRPNSQTDCCLVCTSDSSNNSMWDNPPYQLHGAGNQRGLGVKTIAASAVHYNNILEYDAHNIYGLTNAIMTNNALKTVRQKRPFVLTRSTFIGSGSHAAHWTGDNSAQFNDLGYSIPTMLNFGLFGVPMVGADICGFLGGTNEELCNRWIQLGAFYPFARDHSNKGTPRQELYLWESVTQSAKKALGLRYRLLPYIYTLNYEAHTKGSPMARPLFFTFPEDSHTLDINNQFLLGSGILVSPVLTQGATTVDAYFPKGTWYNLFNFSESVTVNNGSTVTLQAPLDTINVHVYEGTILPMQEMGMTTNESRNSPFSLVVAMGSKTEAFGELFLDSGEDLEMVLASGTSTYIEFHATVVSGGVNLTSQVQMGEYATKQGWMLQTVTLLGSNSSSGSQVTTNVSLPIGKNFELTLK